MLADERVTFDHVASDRRGQRQVGIAQFFVGHLAGALEEGINACLVESKGMQVRLGHTQFVQRIVELGLAPQRLFLIDRFLLEQRLGPLGTRGGQARAVRQPPGTPFGL